LSLINGLDNSLFLVLAAVGVTVVAIVVFFATRKRNLLKIY